MSPTFRSLRIADYRLFWSGIAVSNVGTWMQRVAQDWLVLQLSGGSAAALGITTGLQFLPLLLFTPLGGLLADRVSKLRLLRITQALLAVIALTQGALALTGAIQVWHVYVLAFALGVVNALDNPARQAFVAELVPLDDLPNAVSLNSASFHAARIVGPALAGVLIAAVGTGWVFLLNALTFLGPLVALVLLRRRRLGIRRSGRDVGGLRDGVRYVRSRPDILLVLGIVFFVGTFALNFQMTTALMATQVFGKGASAYGLLGSIMAVGSLAGSLWSARRGRVGYRFVVVAAIAFSLVVVATGLMPTYETFALALVPTGVAALTLLTAANTYVQTSVDPEVRGRVMSLYLMVFMGGTPIGSPVLGWVGETLGARWTIAGGGAAALLGVLLTLAVFGRRTDLDLRPSAPARPHPQLRRRLRRRRARAEAPVTAR